MERRNTIQRDIVLKAVRSLGNHASADEIYSCVSKDYPSIGKGTVYRNLNILAEEGEIRKVEIPEGPNRFDHSVGKHYHITCIKCGKVFQFVSLVIMFSISVLKSTSVSFFVLTNSTEFITVV